MDTIRLLAVALCQVLSRLDWSGDVAPPASLASLDPLVGSGLGHESSIEIGVLGRDSVADALGALVEGRSIRGVPIELVPIDDSADAACDLVYVASSERARVDRVLETLNHAKIPSISTLPEFLSAGGTIEIRMREEVKILVNGDRLRELGCDLAAVRAPQSAEAAGKEARCLDGWPLRFWASACSQ
jgi:hypothetical protein